MGYNSARYIHTIYQAMNLAFADRDFYYGDPGFSARRTRARSAFQGICRAAGQANRSGSAIIPRIRPGDPYPFQGGANPFAGAA